MIARRPAPSTLKRILSLDAKTMVEAFRKSLFDYRPYDYSYANTYTSTPYYSGPHYGTRINYAIEAGDLINNSIVMACLGWVMRTFPQAPVKIVDVSDADNPEEMPSHPLTALLKRPNPYYSGLNLWKPTLLSLNLDGNAYWRKVRNGAKLTKELYYEPHWNIRPRRTSGDEFISHYEIWRNHEWREIDREEIVHFRNGLNPANEMYGLSPLASALREVFTDNEAARYTSAMFMNMGVSGAIVSPESGFQIDDPQRIKQHLTETTTGDRRGEYTVLSVPTRVQWPQVDPGKLVASDARKTPEERVAALIGVPAVVAQLGAGLSASTYSNYDQAIKDAWNNNLIPSYMVIADDLDIQLLPEFGDPARQDIVFDTTGIKELQADEAKEAAIVVADYTANLITWGEARKRRGHDVDEADPRTNLLKFEVEARGSTPEQEQGPPAMTGEDRDAAIISETELEEMEKALVLSNGHKGVG